MVAGIERQFVGRTTWYALKSILGYCAFLGIMYVTGNIVAFNFFLVCSLLLFSYLMYQFGVRSIVIKQSTLLLIRQNHLFLQTKEEFKFDELEFAFDPDTNDSNITKDTFRLYKADKLLARIVADGIVINCPSSHRN
jgi:hypothetical protein